MERERGGGTDRQTDRQDRQPDRQTGRQADRQTERPRQRQTETEIERGLGGYGWSNRKGELLVSYWLPCQAPGAIGSVVRLVGQVLACCMTGVR